MPTAAADDRPTLAALGVVAFAFADVSHEGLGHGLATLAVGGKVDLLTTCFLNSSGPYSKWIPAAGGLANLAVGLCAIAILRGSSQRSVHVRLFVVLVAAFNLFFAFGYPAYSGITNFGDWAAVISGWQPAWLWRGLSIPVSVAGYYGSMWLLAKPIAPFTRIASGSGNIVFDAARFRRITAVPYFAAIILACLAGALNPRGWQTMLNSGLPAAAAAFGLTQLDHLIRASSHAGSPETADFLSRSYPWIATAVAVVLFFVFVLGPGISFR